MMPTSGPTWLVLWTGLHTNVLKHFVYVENRCGKQSEVIVSLYHGVMASSQLLK